MNIEYDYPIQLGMRNASNDLVGVTRFSVDTNLVAVDKALSDFQGPLPAPWVKLHIKFKGDRYPVFFRKMFMVTGTTNLFPGLYLKAVINGRNKTECDEIDETIRSLTAFFITGEMEIDYITSPIKGTFDTPFISQLKIKTFEILDLQNNIRRIVLQA